MSLCCNGIVTVGFVCRAILFINSIVKNFRKLKGADFSAAAPILKTVLDNTKFGVRQSRSVLAFLNPFEFSLFNCFPGQGQDNHCAQLAQP